MNTELVIITNHKPRELVTWHELPESERQWFDYIDCEDDRYSPRFFHYRDAWYDANEFQIPPSDLKGWDGINTETFFSGVLIRWPREYYGIRGEVEEIDTDHVVVARYYVKG